MTLSSRQPPLEHPSALMYKLKTQEAEIRRLRAALEAARPYVEHCSEGSAAAAAVLREIDAMAVVRDAG